MGKVISINVDIKVNNKDKLKRIIKISLFAAVSLAALFGALSISLFYNSGFPVYLLMFVLVFVSVFFALAVLRAAGKRGELFGILLGVFVAVYQVYDTLKRASSSFDGLLPVWVITAVCCISASIISMIISLIIRKRAVKN